MSFLNSFFNINGYAYGRDVKRIKEQNHRRDRRTSSLRRETGARLDALEDQLGSANLLLAGLLETLDRKGSITREEVRAIMEDLDSEDGEMDGRLDSQTLRGLVAPPDGRPHDPGEPLE